MTSGIQIRTLDSAAALGQPAWDALLPPGYPFLRYAFLGALEESGSVSPATGWRPAHMLFEKAGQPVGLMPLYQKMHSYGEYVFDWAWADAYHRHGRDYYPKLLTGIPFTPAQGPRFGHSDEISEEEWLDALVDAVKKEVDMQTASSWHCLFPEPALSEALADRGFSQRLGTQYHWLNQGYRDFDDFLVAFSSRKRKNLKKERRRVAEQGLDLERVEGADIDRELWRIFYTFYHLTYFKRSGRQGYLNEDFFLQLGTSMPEQLMMVVAKQHGEVVAASLFFRGKDTLYGRYWGCSREYDFLHFEACYYQGIEYAIEQGLQRFDPGAQGEHKIQRGFTPVPTWSNHWIAEAPFREAIDDFLERERQAMEGYIEEAGSWLPFKEPD